MRMMLLALFAIAASAVASAIVLNTFAVSADVAFATKAVRVDPVE